MQGATLSPWTMSCFAAACLFLLAGQAMMLSGYGYPWVAISAPETLAVVHVLVIGWLGLLITGALFQFVPVITAQPVRCGKLALPALLLIIPGVVMLASGFAAMAGTQFLSILMLPAGAVLLVCGFVLVAILVIATLYAARPLPLPARFVAIGIASLLLTISMGASFAFALSGIVDNAAIDNLLAGGVELHATLGLGGWMSFTVLGVSYRLLAMFMLSPEDERRSSRIVLWAGSAALALVGFCVILLFIFPEMMRTALLIAGLLTVIAMALYGFDVIHLYRKRRRKLIELNSKASFAALLMLFLAAILIALQALADFPAAPAVYLFVFGWLTGIGLAQLYKIIPFMTWLECYGPLLGKGPVPRVQDLVNERRATVLFCVYYAAVLTVTISLLLERTLLFRASMALQLAATLGLVMEFCAARRLSCVNRAIHPATGSLRPNLILPNLQRKR